MSAQTPQAQPARPATVTFTIDGRKVTCRKGEVILQAGLDAGIFIPHYCYHPSLSIAGNCRMCLVEIVPKPPPNAPPGWKPPPPKPAIACATEAAEGMEVLSNDSKMAKEAREGVMEFLLINHPLDCPICDQAGECELQNFSFQYGAARSRFVEAKNVKHTKDFGPEVRLYGNRCIVCTRCVRFCHEITGTGEIHVEDRGDRSVVDIFPEIPLDNPLSGNVVDICPVGALVSRDFLHKTRVWHLDETDSVCPHCSTGCSISIHSQDESIQRLKPRLNREVNNHWMCDAGRLGYKFVHDQARLQKIEKVGPPANGARRRQSLSFQAAAQHLGRELDAAREKSGAGAVAALASAWMTNEELYLLRELFAETGGTHRIALLAREPWEERRFKGTRVEADRNPNAPGQRPDRTWLPMYDDGTTFVIEADRNPNRRGAELILGADACAPERLEALVEGCWQNEVSALLLFSGMPDYAPPARLLEAVGRVPFVAVVDTLAGPLSERAHLIVPGATFAEKEGTFTNGRGQVQRLRFARATPGQARPELELLHLLLVRLGRRAGGFSPEEAFGDLSAAVPAFNGLRFDDLGQTGKRVTDVAAALAAAGGAAPGKIGAKRGGKA